MTFLGNQGSILEKVSQVFQFPISTRHTRPPICLSLAYRSAHNGIHIHPPVLIGTYPISNPSNNLQKKCKCCYIRMCKS